MQRDISKLLEDYQRKYIDTPSKPGNKGKFYFTDFEQICEISNIKLPMPEPFSSMVLSAIVNAMQAGYMIGYRTAQRDAKRKNVRA